MEEIYENLGMEECLIMRYCFSIRRDFQGNCFPMKNSNFSSGSNFDKYSQKGTRDFYRHPNSTAIRRNYWKEDLEILEPDSFQDFTRIFSLPEKNPLSKQSQQKISELPKSPWSERPEPHSIDFRFLTSLLALFFKNLPQKSFRLGSHTDLLEFKILKKLYRSQISSYWREKNATWVMISFIWFDHAWFSRYFTFLVLLLMGLIESSSHQKFQKLYFFWIIYNLQREDQTWSIIQLTHLSHQYSSRYGLSKFELKFSLTGRSSHDP